MITGNIRDLDPKLLRKLDRLEESLPNGFDVFITSGYRGVDKASSHGYGLAADLRVVGGWQRMKLVQHCIGIFTRIGVYPDHVHVDIDSSRPSPVLWVGCYHSSEENGS